MPYLIAFLEGVITFVSPCLLPMLPIYISYFANGEGNRKRTLINSLGFILGFTIIFVMLGAFAGGIGYMLNQYQTVINILTGLIVIVLGLNFTGIFNVKLFNHTSRLNVKTDHIRFVSSIVFGIVFSLAWTPCVGAFLGSALMLASQKGNLVQGMIMLLLYSIGLGIPYVLSALLLDQLKSTFNFIKRNYKVISIVCGLFLVVVGILMMTGTIGYLLSLLSF